MFLLIGGIMLDPMDCLVRKSTHVYVRVTQKIINFIFCFMNIVSLASWSNSKVYQKLKEVYENELQIDTYSDPEERMAAVAIFLGTRY